MLPVGVLKCVFSSKSQESSSLLWNLNFHHSLPKAICRCLCPEPDESSPHSHILFICNFDISPSTHGSPVWPPSFEISEYNLARMSHLPLYPQKLALNFADRWRSLSRYSSLANKGTRSCLIFPKIAATCSAYLVLNLFALMKLMWTVQITKLCICNLLHYPIRIATAYGLDNSQGRVPRVTNVILLHIIQTGHGPTQPPFQWVPGTLSPGAKGDKGILLTTHTTYAPRSKNMHLYICVFNTSFVASCMTKISAGAPFTPLTPIKPNKFRGP
jgi:hypothetical protein